MDRKLVSMAIKKTILQRLNGEGEKPSLIQMLHIAEKWAITIGTELPPAVPGTFDRVLRFLQVQNKTWIASILQRAGHIYRFLRNFFLGL